MPVEELTNFRSKYPQYDDLTDSQLAGMLSSKYPAYKDLPSRLEATPVKFEGGGLQQFNQLAGGSEAKIQRPPGLTDYPKTLWEEFTAPSYAAKEQTEATGKAPSPLERFSQLLQAANSPFTALSRATTGTVGEHLPVSPQEAEAIGNAVGTVAQGAVLPWRSRTPLAPARTIEDLIPQARPGLPPPAATPAALPAPVRPALPPPAPERMVMGVTPEGVAAPAPKRTVVDLVDEFKQSIKDQAITELMDELKTGQGRAAAAATPPRVAPAQIEPPRQQLEPPKQVIYEGTPEGELSASAWRPVPRETIRNERLQALGLTTPETPPAPATPAPAAAPKPRLTQAETGPMYANIPNEKDPATLLVLATDTKLPRDIRRAAGDRLNDFKAPEIGRALQDINDAETIGKIAKSGTVNSAIQAQAKGWVDLNKPANISRRVARAEKAATTVPQPETPPLLAEEARANIPAAPREQPRTVADLLASQRGAISLGREGIPGEPIPVSATRLTAGGIGEESSKTLTKTMGPEGGELARLSKAIRNDTEIQAHTAQFNVNKVLEGLDKKQLDNLVDVLEGKAKPLDSQVAEAFKTARLEDNKIAARAEKVGLQTLNPITGEKTPFTPRENYYPHMFDKELGDYIKDPFAKANIKEQIKAQLEAGGKEVSDKQVEQALNAMIKATRGREPHLEIARVYNRPDYSRDVKAVLNKHYQDAYQRLNIAEKFGPDLSKGEELLTKIGQNRGDFAESFARTYFQRVAGTEPVNALTNKAVSTAINLNNFTKLGQAAIANASQTAYTAITTGAKNAAKGYRAAYTQEGRDFATKILGSAYADFMEDVGAAAQKSTSGKMSDFILKYTGFNYTERLNRVVSANAGKFYAQDAFEKLLANPNNKRLRDTLEKMNVDVDAALKRGALNELDELHAGQNIVNRTQFKTDVTELPLFWNSPAGRLVSQYKRFQFKAGQFAKDEIIKEALKGNVAPLIRAAVILPAAGFTVAQVRDAIRFGPQTEQARGILDYMATVGTFGAFTDAFAGSGRQPVRGLQQIAGPTLGELGGAWEAGTALTREGNPLPAAKFLAKQIPVVGPSVRNLFNNPPSNSPQAERDRMLKQLGLQDIAKRQKTLEDLGLRR